MPFLPKSETNKSLNYLIVLIYLRCSKQKRNETLISTFDDDMNDDYDAYDEDNIEKEFKDNDSNDIEQIAKDLVADWKINDWVVVLYCEQWYPGIVQNVRILFKITL